MRTTFELGDFTLMVSEDNPRLAGTDRSVGLQVTHTEYVVPEGEKPKTTLVFAANLTPSHARAVASAILSAATETKA
jgi:hypothetical protein